MNLHWDARFLELAQFIANWSKDPSTKVGAVIIGQNKEILSTGYNGFPPGIRETEERLERPTKYIYTEHAERNALYFAALNGVRISGSTMYASLFPCGNCARGIIRTGIARVVAPKPPAPIGVPGDWRDECIIAKEMLLEAGIDVCEMGFD
jgi:dCMP deaminase